MVTCTWLSDLKDTVSSLTTMVEEGQAALEAKDAILASKGTQLLESQTQHSLLTEKV